MSKISIEGNALGSGTLTIAAPNTNSNFTLTLPTESGTVLTNNGNQAGTFSTLTVNSNNISADNSLGFRNRIINGDMRIDQRNAGASVTINTLAGGYTVDRWFGTGKASAGVFTVQRLSASAPSGFTNYLGCTVTTSATPGSTDAYVIGQFIEGFNVADLAWGSASAKSITISFRVYSSLTGTFGGSVANNAANRCYPFSFSISSASTWETKTITIPGDTTGTWTTDNTAGIKLYLDLGSGSSLRGTAGSWGSTFYTGVTGGTNVISTNSATFYITGVQLEVGSVATPFERRPYGTELSLCQRYFQKSFPVNTAPAQNVGGTGAFYSQSHASNAPASGQIIFPVQMRDTPSTFTTYNTSAANGNWRNLTASSDINAALQSTSATGAFITSNTQVMAQYAVAAIQWAASAEL